MGSVDYASATVPAEYHCGKCGAHGVKLWRDYQTFMSHQSLLCAACACVEQSNGVRAFIVKDRPIGGGRIDVYLRSDLIKLDDSVRYYGDQIGWRVPAVPTEDGDSFWGYTSVPDEGCQWWYRLPLEAPR
jgi:hypothetical protein